jgi:predicted GNAT superfamily acetyltransferase
MTTPPIEVRPLRTPDDYRECLRLQRLTWGEGFSEAVPPSLLRVCQRIGGVAAGAFDGDGRMLGFVFGITGVEAGRVVHWSDMLAVRPEAQGRGVGRALKEHQRQAVRALGVQEILWSFDPLVARNAHLNLHRLGARAQDYVVDMYGESDSVLHEGLGTDRLVVAWPVAEPGTGAEQAQAMHAAQEAPTINTAVRDGAPVLIDPEVPDAPAVLVEIPADIHAVRSASVEAAWRWRTSTRAAFLAALGRGYRIVGFRRDAAAGRCFYLLARPDATPEDGNAAG